jgi:hypothetical protein
MGWPSISPLNRGIMGDRGPIRADPRSSAMKLRRPAQKTAGPQLVMVRESPGFGLSRTI